MKTQLDQKIDLALGVAERLDGQVRALEAGRGNARVAQQVSAEAAAIRGLIKYARLGKQYFDSTPLPHITNG